MTVKECLGAFDSKLVEEPIFGTKNSPLFFEIERQEHSEMKEIRQVQMVVFKDTGQ